MLISPRERQEESARGLHPLVEKVVGRGLAKPDLQPFMKPGLQNAQAKKDAHNHQENADLVKKHRDIALADGIVDAALPIVEPHLGDRVRPDDERYDNEIFRYAVLRFWSIQHLPEESHLTESAFISDSVSVLEWRHRVLSRAADELTRLLSPL